MKRFSLTLCLSLVAIFVTMSPLAAAPFTPLPGNGVTDEWCDIVSPADSGAGTLRDRIENYYNDNDGCFFYMFFTFANQTISLKTPLSLKAVGHFREYGNPNSVTGTYLRGTGTEVEPLNITINGSAIPGNDCVFKIKDGFAAKHQIHGVTIIAKDKFHAVCDENNVDLLGQTSPNCPGSLTGEQCEFLGNNIIVVTTDADGDGVSDASETASGTNPAKADSDDDTINDGTDNCPLVSNTDQANADGETKGDACDTDDDNDGILDAAPDNCPLVYNPDQTNTGGDPKGDACDGDDDGDTVADGSDNCPLAANTDQTDADADTLGDACDPDDDNDEIPDSIDNCQSVNSKSLTDTDNDGLGNICDTDDDNDGIIDGADKCPLMPDPDQADTDGDGNGDICDPDDDGDGVSDGSDLCPGLASTDNKNTDGDTMANPCDPDDDNDGAADENDCAPLDSTKSAVGECVLVSTPQDSDGDGILNTADLCPGITAPDNSDPDSDNQANPCDLDDDGDTVADADDCAPLDPAKSTPAQCATIQDTDGDGLTDFQEGTLGTDPTLADSDGDGSNDPADCAPLDATKKTPNECATVQDMDGDGLTNDQEALMGTNPALADSDSDGINDPLDCAPLDAAKKTPNECASVQDMDGDGLTNDQEALMGTNPALADSDSDGVNDPVDCAPLDAAKKTSNECANIPGVTDTDTDGLPDSVDLCDADAGVAANGGCPGTKCIAQDGSVHDKTNTDADADGIDAACDANDNLPDPPAVDSDADGLPDSVDLCDADAGAAANGGCPATKCIAQDGLVKDKANIDADGIDQACDLTDTPPETPPSDDDNDDADSFVDSDGDGINDATEILMGTDPTLADSDGDGVNDPLDCAANDATRKTAQECAGSTTPLTVPDNDPDKDGICNPGTTTPVECTLGTDNTGDNCPFVANSNQADDDHDGIGDMCDPSPSTSNNLSDTDNDGLPDNMETDIFGTDPNNPDTDGDGLNDGQEVTNPYYPLCGPSDPDCDNDGVCDGTGTVVDAVGNPLCAPVTEGQADNCPLTSNGPNTEGISPEKIQQDSDGNGIGDACENDLDGDTIQDSLDNCPMVPNTDQSDTDKNGIGDACDPAFSGSVTGGGGCGCRINGPSADSPANGLVLMTLGIPLFVLRGMRRRADP